MGRRSGEGPGSERQGTHKGGGLASLWEGSWASYGGPGADGLNSERSTGDGRGIRHRRHAVD